MRCSAIRGSLPTPPTSDLGDIEADGEKDARLQRLVTHSVSGSFIRKLPTPFVSSVDRMVGMFEPTFAHTRATTVATASPNTPRVPSLDRRFDRSNDESSPTRSLSRHLAVLPVISVDENSMCPMSPHTAFEKA